MPTEIEDQIASYFTWVEARAGFRLHAPEVVEAESTGGEALVIELDAPNRRRRPSNRIRLAAICGVAASVVVGVVVIANRPAAQPRVPANSVPTTDPRAQAEEAARRAREAQVEAQRVLEARRALEARLAAEVARNVAKATTTTIVVSPGGASSPANDVAVPALRGSYIQNAKMTGPTTGWVVTGDAVARTTDGGATWTQMLPPPTSAGGLAWSFILDDDHAWVMGVDTSGQIVVGRAIPGSTEMAMSPVDPGFSGGLPNGIVFVDDKSGYISIVDPQKNNAIVTGRAALLRTTDGGVSFTLVDTDAPVPLAFVSPLSGWGSGAGLFFTADGAATWTRKKPPLWDAAGPDPNGPSYEIVMASHEVTVVKVVAPTGTQAQVAYVASDDLGRTWRDVAPPNTSESDNSGSRSMLTAVTARYWFGIQQGDGTDAILWTTTDGGANYLSTHLPFPATTITMSSLTTGWATTATDIRSTVDGGATWTKIADIAMPATSAGGCLWLPSFDGEDGAGQHHLTTIRLTNISSPTCAAPSITSITADSVLDGTGPITATQGGAFPGAATPTQVATGESIVIALTTVSALDNCNSPPTRPARDIAINFDNVGVARITLGHAIETACEFAYDVQAG